MQAQRRVDHRLVLVDVELDQRLLLRRAVDVEAGVAAVRRGRPVRAHEGVGRRRQGHGGRARRRRHLGLGRDRFRVRWARLVVAGVVRRHVVVVGGVRLRGVVDERRARAGADLGAVPVDPEADDADVVAVVGPAQRDLARTVDRGSQVARVVGRRGVTGRTVALVGAGVGEGLPRDRHELPVVAARPERELQDAVRPVFADLAVRSDVHEAGVVRAAGPDDERPDAAHWISHTVRCLLCEALVRVVVRGQDQIGIGLVERVPEGLVPVVVTATGAEQRLVPVRQGAGVRVGRKVLSQPLTLRRVLAAPAGLAAVGVEHDHVPGADVVAVVALVRVPGSGAEVAVVSGCTFVARVAPRPLRTVRGDVLVVAHRREGDVLDPPPRQVVGLLVRLQTAAVVLVVAEGHYCRETLVHQQVGDRLLLARVRAALAVVEVALGRVARDVTRSRDHWVVLRCQGERLGNPKLGRPVLDPCLRAGRHGRHCNTPGSEEHRCTQPRPDRAACCRFTFVEHFSREHAFAFRVIDPADADATARERAQVRTATCPDAERVHVPRVMTALLPCVGPATPAQ